MMHIWCLDPSVAMKDLAAYGIRSVILTSGTLSPLDTFASELQLPFPIRLENKHIVHSSQVCVNLVTRGPRNVPLNCSYQSRNQESYKTSLGELILQHCQV